MMYYEHLVGMINFPEFNVLTWHYFQSQNIATAKAILHIYINLWVGNTKINRVNTK
jgi:hypothetical protein